MHSFILSTQRLLTNPTAAILACPHPNEKKITGHEMSKHNGNEERWKKVDVKKNETSNEMIKLPRRRLPLARWSCRFDVDSPAHWDHPPRPTNQWSAFHQGTARPPAIVLLLLGVTLFTPQPFLLFDLEIGLRDISNTLNECSVYILYTSQESQFYLLSLRLHFIFNLAFQFLVRSLF